MRPFKVDAESVAPLLRAALDGNDANSWNVADALLADAPAIAVVLHLANTAVRPRGLHDFDGPQEGDAVLALRIAHLLPGADPKALLGIAAALDAIGEEASARGFTLAAGGTLGWAPDTPTIHP